MRRLLFFLIGCGCGSYEAACIRSVDCDPGEICHAAECIPLPEKSGSPRPEKDGHMECGPEPRIGDIVVNEVLFAVPPGDEGDANRDGIRDAYADEFVEITNTTDRVLELRGVSIFNGGKQKFAFTGTCLQPDHAVVVFGGGNPALIPNGIISTRRFGLANAGGRVSLRLGDEVLDSVSYGGTEDRSITRNPDIRGETFRPHAVTRFSPGFCENGRSFPTGCESD